MPKKRIKNGFTIVELLIVIVVIGILAAITLISYSGIQERARAASVSSALTQVSKKLAVYAVDNGSYPDDLVTAGVRDAASVTYQYSVNKTTNPQTFCVTATTGTTSYLISQDGAPVSGGCAGHGVGGVAAITNLVTNPSFEANVADWNVYTGLNVPTRVTTNPWSGVARLAAVGNNTASNPRVWYSLPVATGDTISVSVRERSDGQTPNTALFVIKSRLGGTETGTVVILTPAWVTDANGWMTLSATYTVGANIDNLMIQPGIQTATNFTGTLGVDAVIAVKGVLPINYADGNSANWTWNGSANNSTSTGPAL